MDDDARQMKKAWKAGQRGGARAAFPLADEDLAALFDAVDAGLEEAGCDHSLRFTRKWLTRTGHDAEKVVAWLEENGGFCDGEVAANARDHWEQNR